MEDKGRGLITAFDSLFTTNKIQMLKILFTRLSLSSQGSFAVYIKFLELQYTIQFFRTHSSVILPGERKPLSLDLINGDSTEVIELLDELLPFSSPEEQNKIENMKNMLNGIKRMKEMMEMLQMLQEMFPEGFESGGNPADILSGLSGMSGMSGMENMDLSSLFQMFGNT